MQDLETPDGDPHVTMLMIGHADLCGRLAAALLTATTMPKDVIRGFLHDHAATLRAAGQELGLPEAADHLANGVEVNVSAYLSGDVPNGGQ